jgi:hypothetical protein
MPLKFRLALAVRTYPPMFLRNVMIPWALAHHVIQRYDSKGDRQQKETRQAHTNTPRAPKKVPAGLAEANTTKDTTMFTACQMIS